MVFRSFSRGLSFPAVGLSVAAGHSQLHSCTHDIGYSAMACASRQGGFERTYSPTPGGKEEAKTTRRTVNLLASNKTHLSLYTRRKDLFSTKF